MALFRTTRGLTVEAGEDAGGYYCEHVLFEALRWATQPEASAQRDEHGDPMVGFLHVPRVHDTPGAADRHEQTCQVLAAAIRGWARSAGPGPLSLLVTGFGPFRDVLDNPTGDLVRREGPLARAVDLASAEVTLIRRHLDVDASAIDGGPTSIQAELARCQPEAVLCLGVSTADHYVAETVATAAGLSKDGGPAVDEATRLPPNASLARAIERGGRWLWKPC